MRRFPRNTQTGEGISKIECHQGGAVKCHAERNRVKRSFTKVQISRSWIHAAFAAIYVAVRAVATMHVPHSVINIVYSRANRLSEAKHGVSFKVAAHIFVKPQRIERMPSILSDLSWNQ